MVEKFGYTVSEPTELRDNPHSRLSANEREGILYDAGGKGIGAIHIRIDADEITTQMFLKFISISPLYRRQGQGTKLLQKAEEWAREFNVAKITGTILSNHEGWLPFFYLQNGYDLIPQGRGFTIHKNLQ